MKSARNYIFLIIIFFLNASGLQGEDSQKQQPSSIIEYHRNNDFRHYIYNRTHNLYRKIAADRVNFWETTQHVLEIREKIMPFFLELRENPRHPNFINILLSIYEIDRGTALRFARYYESFHPCDIIYKKMLRGYYEQKMGTLENNHKERAIQWSKSNADIFDTSPDAPYRPLYNMGNPCAVLAYTALVSHEPDPIIIQEKKEAAERELDYLYNLAVQDIEYLVYLIQDLYICGFCFDEQVYQSWLHKAKDILEQYKENLLYIESKEPPTSRVSP